ncbi:hypothetical protein [Streptomyces virginiae]|uniref:hypothetical protein n=1 Tax=Streptomyces virginiae TaxID=1961 RepID=UPI00224EB29A|nr:hypothetical protein [Streptomyces virginiae]MCX5174466.1 hypothetical protein [Streptomyces virginiae]
MTSWVLGRHAMVDLRYGAPGQAARIAWAFPDSEEQADDQPAPIDATVQQRRRAFAATETAAPHRARAERAQRAGAAVILPHEGVPVSATSLHTGIHPCSERNVLIACGPVRVGGTLSWGEGGGGIRAG